MSTRIAMSGLGFVLVAGGGALATSRALQAGPMYPATLQVSPSLVYTVAAIGVAIGALLWLLTPQPTRRRRHVQLDKNPLAGSVPRPTGKATAPRPGQAKANGQQAPDAAQGGVATATGLKAGAADAPPERARTAAPEPEAPEVDTADPRHRIDELAAEANRLKVEYALGRVSPHGYKAAVDAIDRERSELESALFQASRGSSGSSA